MDLQNIQDQLNTEFAKDSTKYIFWFDDKAEYEDEVSELQLGDVKLHILDGTNWLYSKYLLNEKDIESKYLIYAPFPRPSDAENPLADMYYYSIPYYTDRVSQTSQEMGIDNRFKEQLSQYTRFWKNKNNIEKFKNLGIDHFNQQTIDIGLIAVLVDVKTPNFEEITKQMILGDSAKYMKALTDNGITDKFWELCNLFFGYQSDKPSIDDLAASMIVTYAASSLKGTVPVVFKPYILKKRNDVVVFIRNIMDNKNLKESYDALAEKVNKTLRFVAKVQEDLKKDNEKSKDRSLQLADIFACDAFAGFDDIIIEWALSQLDDEILDSQIDGLTIAQIADQRSSMAYHYCDTYKYEYEFGFEESYGCLVGTHARDKDAVVAVMALCEAAAYYKTKNMTLWDQMIQIFEKYGYYKEGQKAITMKGAEGAEKIAELMDKLRNETPKKFGSWDVLEARDYKKDECVDLKTGEKKSTGLPSSNVLYYALSDNAWCCARPSGTEPKIKFYMGVKGSNLADADAKLEELTKAVMEVAGQ